MAKRLRFEPSPAALPYMPAKLSRQLLGEHGFREHIFGIHELETGSGSRAIEVHVRDYVPGNVRSDLVRFARSLEESGVIARHDVLYSKKGASMDAEGAVLTHPRHYRLVLHLK